MQIKLSTKSFNPESAEVLARGIANVRGSLVDADLSDIIAGASRSLTEAPADNKSVSFISEGEADCWLRCAGSTRTPDA